MCMWDDVNCGFLEYTCVSRSFVNVSACMRLVTRVRVWVYEWNAVSETVCRRFRAFIL